MYIVELMTTTGPVCEPFATYAEARRRIDQFPAETLVGTPLLFMELPDGSQRFVREDGKPLQIHRLPDDRFAALGESIPLADPSATRSPAVDDDDVDPPIPLVGD